MRTGLQLAAFAVAFVSLVFWLFGGPHFGRTQTSRAATRINPATGAQETFVEKRLVPGIDFIASAWLVAGGILAASFLIRKR